jgi:hypothetical protein
MLSRELPGSTATKPMTNRVDPQVAIDRCPYLKLLAEDLLCVAKLLQ